MLYFFLFRQKQNFLNGLCSPHVLFESDFSLIGLSLEIILLININVWTSFQKLVWGEKSRTSRRFGCYNGLLTGLFKMLRKLQQIENAFAGVPTGTKRSDHITGILKALHWLPVIREPNRSLCCLFLNQYTRRD